MVAVTAERLQCGILAVSLLNAMLLGWLALTVLLNARRRTLGLLLTDSALLVGALFFLMQAAVAGSGYTQLLGAMYLQWPLGWIMGLALALAWYLSILWHADALARPGRSGGMVHVGRTEANAAPPRAGRRHRVWLAVVIALFAATLTLALLAMPYPWTVEPTATALFSGPHLGSWPLLALLYPVFVLICLLLSMEALVRARGAGPVEQLAHRRSLPWLLAATGFLLVVAAVTGGLMLTAAAGVGATAGSSAVFSSEVVWGDLLVSGAVTLALLCLGQAIVSYEIFTGKALPRQGLKAQWYGAIFLATLYGTTAAWMTAVEHMPFYGLLLATVLIVVFYALYNWRATAERDRLMGQLRPAVGGPALFETLVQRSSTLDAAAPLAALCRQVLSAELAYLIPVGALGPVAGPALCYPEGRSAPGELGDLLAACSSPDVALLALDPARAAGAMWALPLWTERGLVGLLLLGPKAGTGLYSHEELEIARASAERLVDTIACGRLAQRLMALQRQRLSESQVADRRARRVLHDEVLPRLHAVTVRLAGLAAAGKADVVEDLAAVHRDVSALLRDLPPTDGAAVGRLGLIGALRRLIQEELPEAFDEVVWAVEPQAEAALRELPALTGEVVFHAAREALRNAARHGRGGEPGRRLRVRVSVTPTPGLELSVADDGMGTGGREGDGRGLALHSTLMAVIGGEWITEGAVGGGTVVRLRLPDSGA